MYTTGDKLLNVMKEEEIGIAAYCEAKRPSLRNKTAAFRF